MTRQLPPYGRQHLECRGSSGAWVAIGSGAWAFAPTKPFPVMVLPPGDDPARYAWPVARQPVLLLEMGSFNTAYLERVCRVLLEAGASWVQPIREAQLPGYPPVRHGQRSPIYRREVRHVE